MPSSRQPKYRRIMEVVSERIARGLYAPDAMIPSERALARELATNHETANKAIAHLVAEGVLYRKRGIGTFVLRPGCGAPQPPPQRVVDLLLYKRASELFGASSFHEEIVFSLQTMLATRGFACNIVPVLDVEDFGAYVRQVDGVVISKFLPDSALRILESEGKPVVSLNFSPPIARLTPVVVEHRAVGALCRELVERGHRRIAFVKAAGFEPSQELRLLRFRAFMESAGLAGNMSRVLELPAGDQGAGGEGGQRDEGDPLRLLRPLEGCSAAMAADDFLAIKLRHLLSRARLRVPEDLSLAGYGNLSITRSLYPALTTADVDREALCAAAVEEMGRWLAGRGSEATRVFASFPLLRASIAAAPGSGLR